MGDDERSILFQITVPVACADSYFTYKVFLSMAARTSFRFTQIDVCDRNTLLEYLDVR